ncbi:ras guanine nucleotide exchange factor P-like [Mya arenaria]|uniref:ras guanine nucleotide exchange factor P-like n=1 Tax=Mya arenaria TaxID=6604 RepID=UPI0022DECBD6|nr:ras guanine nucleotide exchange factor P-like [Mya arenaria]
MSNQRNKTNDAQKSTGQDAEQNDISGHETSQKTYPAALGATGAFMDEPDSSPVAPKPSSFRTKPDPRPKPKRPSSSSVQQRNGLSSGVPYKAVVPGTAEADKEIDPQSTRSTFAPSQDTLNPRTWHTELRMTQKRENGAESDDEKSCSGPNDERDTLDIELHGYVNSIRYQTLDLYSHDNQHSDNSSVNKSDNNQGQETIPKTVDTALKASTNTEDRRTDPKTATRNVNAAARSKPPSRRRTDDKEDVVVVGTGKAQSISTGLYYFDGSRFQRLNDTLLPSERGPTEPSEGSDFLLVEGARSRDGRESDRPESVYTSVDSIYNQQSDINSNNKSDNKSDNNHDQETVPKAIEIALEASENTEGRISTDPKKSTRREKPDAGSKQPSRRRTDHKEDVVVVGTGNPQSISTGMYYYDGTGFQPIRDPQMPSEIGPMAMSDDGSDFLLVQGAMSRDGRRSDRPKSAYKSVDSIYPGRRFRAELGRRVLANPGHDVNVSTSMTDPETLNVSINVSLNIAELLRSHQGSTNGNRNTSNNTENEASNNLCQTLELFSQDNQQSDINSDNKSDNKSDNNHDQETIPKTIEIALEASEYTEGRISTDSKKATRREKPDAGSKQPSRRTDHKEDVGIMFTKSFIE